MCGIAGVLRQGQEVSRDEIERLTSALSHRGPDGSGIMIRENLALGHRRLAIIDLATGSQPMCSADEKIAITYNGEIYNFRELKGELQQKGHVFRTSSDTEVIIESYREWGIECLRRFRGMFAFALADFDRRSLLLARDHFGIKPLYWRERERVFAFASELSALKGLDAPASGASVGAIDLFLRYQYIPAPRTVYADVHKLPPASFMTISFDGVRTDPVQYWSPSIGPAEERSDEEWEELLESAIHESVSAHLVADVPFGVLLSGGIDSTLVASAMARILRGPVKAFSIGFRELGISEIPYAKTAAANLGLELHHETIDANHLDLLPELLQHHGEPFGDDSAVATWYVSKLAREHVPMVLSGDGGDEGLAGYERYADWVESSFLTRARRVWNYWPYSLLGSLPAIGSHHRRRILRALAWQTYTAFLSEPARRSLWQPAYREAIRTQDIRLYDAALHAPSDDLSFAQFLDYQTYLPFDILTKVDVASMSHGLEVRTPLIDRDLQAIMAKLPVVQRQKAEPGDHIVGKPLAKRIVAKRFSREFAYRPKQGFSIPKAQWFSRGSPYRARLEDQLMGPSSGLPDLFDREQIARYLLLHNIQGDYSGALWLLLVLAVWLEQNPGITFGL